MKIVGMIPARLGSQRVKRKNIRLINGKPLINYIVESAILSEIFNDIYINSESEVFKEIAEYNNIKFYKRPEHLASYSATNDDFALDFLQNNECDILIQLLATSPFISPDDIKNFVQQMLNKDFDTMISVKNEQIECIYKNEPVNFNENEKTQPSQTLIPIQAYACGIMGWKSENFKSNMKRFNCAYHGCDGKVGYYELKGYATVDIDTEEDFKLAEAVAQTFKGPQFYSDSRNINTRIEVDVPSILKKDGIKILELFDDTNRMLSNINEIRRQMPDDISWSKRVVNTENNSATLISQLPGEGNRRHFHTDWNEWWYIIDGIWEFEIEGEKYDVKKDDIVFIERGKRHRIEAKGDKPAIRLAISREDVAHIYNKNKED